MGDSVSSSELRKTGNKARIIYEAPSRPFSSRIAYIRHGKSGNQVISDIGMFVLKVAALETVRRLSKAKCPFLWRGLQALQVLTYPPLKWIQKFAPFKSLIRGTQMFSRPMLLLSIATALIEVEVSTEPAPNDTSEANPSSDVHSEVSTVQDAMDTRVGIEGTPTSASETWLIQLHEELEKQGINLPERINDDELHRFYRAANSDSSCFLTSIKKTIRWRETYRILSAEELEIWSNMVFWHGFDVKQRPCLVVRLGKACVSVPPPDRPSFAQAIISQVEHGVLHFLDTESSEITVLLDCEGLSPFKVPMQIMRSCSSLLQDHFPNRLGSLYVVRLPPVVRVVAQTFIQMLRPVTRKKLRVEGENFRKVLSEHLRALPSYIGSNCTCEICSEMSNRRDIPNRTASNGSESDSDGENALLFKSGFESSGHELDGNCDQIIRSVILSVLILWVFIALIVGINDPESSPFSSSS